MDDAAAPDSTPATGPGLVFACIAPHGGLAVPEACGPDERDLAPATQQGMRELARRCEAAAPDALVILTPHGIHLDGHFAVVTAGRVAGALEDTPQTVALDVPVARELALGILAALEEAGIPAAGVSFGLNIPADAVMPLDWGTLIPLWYLGGRRDPPWPVVVVAPARDRPLAEHVAAGVAIADASRRSGLRVGLVASADHAHTHRADGPYGFNPRAGELDEQIVSAVREGRLLALLDLDPELVEAARPDSWWQLLMLGGSTGDAWRPDLISFETPSYFSMLCATFEPPQ
jgi:aromatic ring-opening dioxygenase LigB subunit